MISGDRITGIICWIIGDCRSIGSFRFQTLGAKRMDVGCRVGESTDEEEVWAKAPMREGCGALGLDLMIFKT